nr:hypothetical protein [Tanacetum cinerariifolium]
KSLGGRRRRKENSSLKEVIFTKADESSSKPALEIASDTESEGEIQEPLPPLPKLTGQNPLAETKLPIVPKSFLDKKVDPSTEQLLFTMMEEVKGLKEQIKTPSCTFPSDSQASSSKFSKQKTWFGPYKHCGLRNHPTDDCYSKPKCSTCGTNDHLTKDHIEQAVVKKTLIKLKA